MTFKYAITRKPCENFASGLTTSKLGEPDFELMLIQHNNYVETLKKIGLNIIILKPEEDYPDAHFVEDTAIVTPKVAIITNPGAKERQGEEETIEPLLKEYRKTERITQPGTVDGGDILMVKNHFFIGTSDRTNDEGANQLVNILNKYNHSSSIIKVKAGLHLKSSVNYIGKNTLVITKEFCDLQAFKNFNKIIPNKEEEYAANSLLINNYLLTPVGYPQILNKFKILGYQIIELDMSEVQKMDGGLTCLSLRLD